MDSTFLGAIIQVSKKLMKVNGKMVLIANPEKLKILYALNELKKILTVAESIDEGIIELETRSIL
jgi:anti-anti-sigma regulatory factor